MVTWPAEERLSSACSTHPNDGRRVRGLVDVTINISDAINVSNTVARDGVTVNVSNTVVMDGEMIGRVEGGSRRRPQVR